MTEEELEELKELEEYQEIYYLIEAYNIDPNNLDFQMKLEYFLSECSDMRSCDFEEMVKNYKNK